MRRLGAIYRTSIEMLIPIMALLMFTGATARYIFAFSPVWLTELISFLHAIIFLSLAGYALRDNKHVRIDIVSASLTPRVRHIIDVAGFFLLLAPYCGCIAWFSYDFISASWNIHEGSREYGGLAGVFLLKTCIWLYTLTLCVDGFRVYVLRQSFTTSDHEASSCS